MDNARTAIEDRLKYITTWIVYIQMGLLFGLEAVFIAAFAGDGQFEEAYNHPTPLLQGVLTSAYPIFAGIGSLGVLVASRMLSSRSMLIIGVQIWLVGYVLSACIVTIPVLIIGRMIKGFAIGVVSAVIPLYATKTYENTRAAKLLVVSQSSAPLGILGLAIIGNLVYKTGRASFQRCWLFAAAPVFPVALLTFYLPAEPQQLIIKRQRFLDEIKDLVKTPRFLVKLVNASAVQASWQFTGYNVLIYYMTTMCSLLGLGQKETSAVSMGIYAISFVGTVGSIPLIQRMPRATMLRWSLTTMAGLHGSMYIVMLVGEAGDSKSTRIAGIITVALCFVFVFVFAFIFAGLSLVYTSEMVPMKYRSTSLGIATAVGWFTNFIISLVAPMLMDAIAYHIFLVFTYTCSLMAAAFAAM